MVVGWKWSESALQWQRAPQCNACPDSVLLWHAQTGWIDWPLETRSLQMLQKHLWSKYGNKVVSVGNITFMQKKNFQSVWPGLALSSFRYWAHGDRVYQPFLLSPDNLVTLVTTSQSLVSEREKCKRESVSTKLNTGPLGLLWDVIPEVEKWG